MRVYILDPIEQWLQIFPIGYIFCIFSEYIFLIKEMGCNPSAVDTTHSSLKRIKGDEILHVASLNYCGILKSPFEFYSGKYQEQLTNLSRIFQQLKGKYVQVLNGQPFSWKFGKLDKKVKEKRYCPLYNPHVGVVNGRLISREQFIKIWQERMTKAQHDEKLSVTANDREQAKKFDLLSYHTLLRHIYSVENIDQAQGKDANIYLDVLKQLFDQTFLDEDKKIDKFKEALNHTISDIVFVQEANDKLIKALQHNQTFHIETSPDKDTLICVKKEKFKVITPMKSLSLFEEEDFKLLEWNNHSTVIIADRFILIAGHLSSNKSMNAQERGILKKGFEMLCQKHSDFDVICGVDVNSFIGQFNPKVNVFPKEDSVFTSLKKRTSMQTQSEKAEKELKESKDAIMSTLPIIDGQVSTINLVTPSDTTFLPEDDHPFDHFLVFSKLNKGKETKASEISA